MRWHHTRLFAVHQWMGTDTLNLVLTYPHQSYPYLSLSLSLSLSFLRLQAVAGATPCTLYCGNCMVPTNTNLLHPGSSAWQLIVALQRLVVDLSRGLHSMYAHTHNSDSDHPTASHTFPTWYALINGIIIFFLSHYPSCPFLSASHTVCVSRHKTVLLIYFIVLASVFTYSVFVLSILPFNNVALCCALIFLFHRPCLCCRIDASVPLIHLYCIWYCTSYCAVSI